jgi:hypothetical protein
MSITMDIVERLRLGAFTGDDITDAADEIERLRAELDHARIVLSGLRLRSEGDKLARESAVKRIERALT